MHCWSACSSTARSARHGLVLHDHAGRLAAGFDCPAGAGDGPAQAPDVRPADPVDAGGHCHGPDAHHPDPGPGADARRRQGRHRPRLLRRHVRHGGQRWAADPAGGHGAQRGLRRGPHQYGNHLQGRVALRGRLHTLAGPAGDRP
ncbi:hypothetical protein G6F63_015249 [Rhizopus arrhizus]|nr:hypothetical protein G6F63_015249 [Rhizopus arrhizus]